MDLPLIHTEKNEIGELANQFRLMSANLKQSFDELHSQKDILWTIMNSINQALWIIDNNAHIKMANRHFGDLFFPSKLEGAGGGSDYYDEYLFDLTRNNDIIRLYHDILDEKTHLTREIEFNDKIYLCTVSYLQSNKNIIFTMLDISDIKSLEKMKKDLISNVSHELKTPLTAIKGFVETMMEDSTDEHRNYLEIIGRNTERLIAIVNDLLTLSKLEQTTKIIRQEIDIRAFFERVTSIVGNQSSVNITVDIADELKTFSADEFMMEQVFINLIDNAIKYGDKGTIKISAFKADYRLIFTVSDEGIGIPKHDLKRIFERFYVVDKSRSKRLGGTGLGLSIVKHIVHLHNGEISVESEEGKGSVFTIEMYL
jgi:two-component system phosphate regulon sensor histidine kinase PhoR